MLLFFDRAPACDPTTTDALKRAAQSPEWLCRRCGYPITRPAAAIERGGAHRHRFTNPAGQTFVIGCFGAAPGCRAVGRSWREFSWFTGYRWRVALCGRCQTHLGWRYDGPEPFFGLILDHLRAAG